MSDKDENKKENSSDPELDNNQPDADVRDSIPLEEFLNSKNVGKPAQESATNKNMESSEIPVEKKTRNKRKSKVQKPKAGGSSDSYFEGKTQRLIELVLDTGLELFHDTRREAYARVDENGAKKTYHLESRDFQLWLGNIAYEQMKWALNEQSSKTVNTYLQSRAIYDGQKYELHNRVAKHNNEIWVDLDGSKAACIRPGAWEVKDNPPILFKWHAHNEPLPDPIKKGDPKQILELMNLQDSDAELLIMTYLVCCFIPEIPVGALVLNGVPGSAKTTLMRLIKKIVDPGIPETHGKVSNKNYHQIAEQTRMLIFDNLSKLTDDQSNQICGSVTEQGQADRKHYSNRDTVVFKYRNVIGITGVAMVPRRSDLLDRSILLTLDPVGSGKRLRETDLWQRFNSMAGEVLGGIFDVLSEVLASKARYTVVTDSRLVDFIEFAAVAAECLGWSVEEYLAAYERTRESQFDQIMESSPVIEVVVKLMDSETYVKKTPTALHENLEEFALELGVDIEQKSWPKSAVTLSNELAYNRELLLEHGIIWEKGRVDKDRFIILRKGCLLQRADNEEILDFDPETGFIIPAIIDVPEGSPDFYCIPGYHDDHDDRDDAGPEQEIVIFDDFDLICLGTEG